MSSESEQRVTGQEKEDSVLLFAKSIYQITVQEIKDPILRAILAVGILLLALAGFSMILGADIPSSVTLPLLLLGVIVALFGLAKWVIGVASENRKEKALSDLRGLLRAAKRIRGVDSVQEEMGLMIRGSSEEDFIIDAAQRIAKHSLQRVGKKVKLLADLPKLYEMKDVPQSACMEVKQIVQAVVDEVSWKRNRIYIDEDTHEQIVQYPSAMLLSDEFCGGCVDKVVLLCSLLRALKFRVRFRFAMTDYDPTKGGESWGHVWAEVYLPLEQGGTEWIPLDPYEQGFQVSGKEEWKNYWNKSYTPKGFPPSEEAAVYEL